MSEHLKNLTSEEWDQMAETYWAYAEAAGHAQRYLNSAYPSIITSINTQFCGQHWYPNAMQEYFHAILSVLELIRDADDSDAGEDGDTCRIDGWTCVVSPDSYHKSPMTALVECFPELCGTEHKRMLTLLRGFRRKAITEERLMAELFELFSGRTYAYVSDITPADEVLTVYAPVGKYDEDFIRGTYIPGYLAALDEDNEAQTGMRTKRQA